MSVPAQRDLVIGIGEIAVKQAYGAVQALPRHISAANAVAAQRREISITNVCAVHKMSCYICTAIDNTTPEGDAGDRYATQRDGQL
jgi:hypothetical protein